MQMTGITQIGADAAQESQSNANDEYESSYERFDLDGVEFGKQHVPTAVRGEAVALRKLYDEDDPDRADVAVILDTASVVTTEAPLEGTRVVTSDEEGDQFKVVNLDDEQTAALGPGGKIDDRSEIDDEGDLMGIDFAGNTFYGEVGTEFGVSGQIALKRGGGAGRSIASVLDTTGARAAQSEIERDEDGDIESMELDDGGFPAHNGGYVEYHPDGREGERPRQSRDPDLRPDVAGEDIVVMIQRLSDVDPDYDGPAYWATVFASLPEDRMTELAEQYAEESDDKSAEDFIAELDGDEFLRLKPTEEFAPDEDLVDETGWISWNGLDRSSTDEIQFLNQERLDAGHTSVYVPEGMTVEEAVGDATDAEAVVTNPDDDTPDDTITAFGGGIGQDGQVEAEA